MGQETGPEHVSKKRVVYRIPGMEDVRVLRDVEYKTESTGALTMDIYYPHGHEGEARLPAVVIVAGYPDQGFEKIMGRKFKEIGSSVSWGQLMAASGLAAITYRNREPEADIYSLLEYVRRNAEELKLDENRMGVWASSGNVPLALSVLMREDADYLKCAVLCYGLMLDLDGANHVAEAARQWGFANPSAGREIEALPARTPLFIVRAGRDEMPHLNETMDRFLCKAVATNLPLTLVNHRDAPHAFDLFHDSELSRAIIKQILEFMRFHLLARSIVRPGST